MRLGVVYQSANKQDHDLLFADPESPAHRGTFPGRRRTEPIGVDAQGNRFQPDVQPRLAAVSVAQILGIAVGDRPDHRRDGARSADQGVVWLERRGDVLAELFHRVGGAERVSHAREGERPRPQPLAGPGVSRVDGERKVELTRRGLVGEVLVEEPFLEDPEPTCLRPARWVLATVPLEPAHALAVPYQDGQLGPGSMGKVRFEERPTRNLPTDQAGGPVPAGPAPDRGQLDVGVVIVEEPDVARPKIGVDHGAPRPMFEL